MFTKCIYEEIISVFLFVYMSLQNQLTDLPQILIGEQRQLAEMNIFHLRTPPQKILYFFIFSKNSIKSTKFDNNIKYNFY